MNKKLIVGIDPGTTTGIALLDLDGNLILTESRKNFSVGGVSKFILENGKPIVIATDIQPLPKFIEKVAANFYAKIIMPDHTPERSEKNKLVKEYLKKIERRDYKFPNRHEKDALAAAVYAWKRIRPLFNKIEQELGKRATEDVKINVLLKRKSIKSVLREKGSL